MKTKKCTRCHKIHNIVDFRKCKWKDKIYRKNICKYCDNKKAKERSKSKIALTANMYSSQRGICIKRNREMPKYNLKQLREWIYLQPNFEELYNNWVKSDYKKEFKPSIDRLDDYKTYSLDNIQLTTWKKNIRRYYSDRMNGINNKQNRAVIQYDLQGNYVNEFYSMCQAERDTSVNNHSIWKNCTGRLKTAGGYIWKYKKMQVKLTN